MNDVARSLNACVQAHPRVYSLHAADGHAVAFFASSNQATVAGAIAEWVTLFDQGFVVVCWLYGCPHCSLGKGDS